MNLSHFTVIDLSHRLPGPLCGKLMADLGAKVLKVEDEKFKDSFIEGLFADFDNQFVDWYHSLNQTKGLIRLKFSAEEDQAKVRELIDSADAVILGVPPKLKESFGLTPEKLKVRKKPLAIIEMGADPKNPQSAMHDLNAMAESGLLKLFLADKNEDYVLPPFLPFAGIALGQAMATQMLGAYLLSQKEGKAIFHTVYLAQVTKELFGPFWSQNLQAEKRYKFLHNGAYPCYALYRTKDGSYIALAAVEDKFWARLNEIFHFPLEISDRFNTSQKSFEKMAQVFKKFTVSEIKQKIGDESLCLSIVH